jgi:hypothetical protein
MCLKLDQNITRATPYHIGPSALSGRFFVNPNNSIKYSVRKQIQLKSKIWLTVVW